MKEIIVRGVDCTSANKTIVVIENAAGTRLVKIIIRNDGSDLIVEPLDKYSNQ